MTLDQEQLKTPLEACRMLQVSLPTLYRLVNQRQLQAHRVGRQLRFLPQDLRDYLERGKTQAQGR